MKKKLAIVLVVLLIISNWFIGYSMIPNFWFGVLWILITAVGGSLGGLAGIFIIDNLFKK